MPASKPVTLINPRTKKDKTFPSARSASVYERKGWKRKDKSASKSTSTSSSGGASS